MLVRTRLASKCKGGGVSGGLGVLGRGGGPDGSLGIRRSGGEGVVPEAGEGSVDGAGGGRALGTCKMLNGNFWGLWLKIE